MIEMISKIDLKKYGLLGGILMALFLIGWGIWMYLKEVSPSDPQTSIDVSSIPPSSVGEDKEPEFSDVSLNAPPLEPILEEETSSDIFIEVKEGSSSDEKEKALSSDSYFNEGVSYDQENRKDLAMEAYEKALLLSEKEPFHFSKEEVVRRLKFLKAGGNFGGKNDDFA
jgi:hypothetical protein